MPLKQVTSSQWGMGGLTGVVGTGRFRRLSGSMDGEVSRLVSNCAKKVGGWAGLGGGEAERSWTVWESVGGDQALVKRQEEGLRDGLYFHTGNMCLYVEGEEVGASRA